jgi:hypothetical protein
MITMPVFAADNKIQVNPNTRIIQTDVIGNPMYNRQQYQVVKDKIYKTDAIGNIQYNKGSLQIVGTKIYKIDSIGNIQYYKESLQVISSTQSTKKESQNVQAKP